MLSVFLAGVLPVFAVTAVGYGFRRFELFDSVGAAMVNRFVFYAALPALLFRLIGMADIFAIDARALWIFLGVETVVYALGFALARWLFARSVVESLLLGLAAALANHVFLVLPIGATLFGDPVAEVVTAVILMDSVILFGCSVVLVDLASSGAVSPRRVVEALIYNPPVLAIAVGLAVSAAEIGLHPGVLRFTEFLGAAAAPAALFALGVILADRAVFEDAAAPIAIAAMKLAAAPILTFLALEQAGGVADASALALLLVAAGPCGAMPFVIGMRFGAPVAAVSRAILYSTPLSAALLTVIAAQHL